jgi:hypothetical protein
MPYRILVQRLWPVADGVESFLRREWGIRNLRVEQALYKEIKPIPTLLATMSDSHTLWVEVSNRAYPTHLDGIAADCMQHGFPVRLVVAVPDDGAKGKIFHEDLTRARLRGVGVIAVEGNNGRILANPLSLSLAGVHPIPRTEFPAKLRYQLSQAEATFREGNPAKGCDDLYSIVENVSRKIAKATFAAGYWKAGANPLKFETDSWGIVMEALVKNLDIGKCKLFGDNVLHRVIGVIPYRNKVVHFRTPAELRKRDQMLRTRFEDAANILLELLVDAKTLKI